MKYHVEFQPMSKGDTRPTDDGQSISAHSFDGESGVALLPQVGDFVHCQPSTTRSAEEYAAPAGRVKSRLFTYFGNESCYINIVLEEVDDKAVWAALIKS